MSTVSTARSIASRSMTWAWPAGYTPVPTSRSAPTRSTPA
jgi:hypothetical protein